MPLRLLQRLRYLWQHRQLDAELAEELEFHRLQKQVELEQNGLSSAEAESASRKALGNATLAREDVRAVWIWRWLDDLCRDIRYAIRTLTRNPGFSCVAVLSLALGIGATTAVFSAVHGLLVSPYPYQGADRMVVMSQSLKTGPVTPTLVTSDESRSLMQARSVEGGMTWDDFWMWTTSDGLPESVHAGKLSPNAFQFLGVPPLLGRTFSSDLLSATTESPQTVVLSYRYWHGRFGGTRDVLGQVLRLDQQDYTIIGVMPDRFRFLNSDVYVPLPLGPSPSWMMLRLKPSVTQEAATAELQAIVQHELAVTLHDPHATDARIYLKSVRDEAVGHLTAVLGVLVGAVALLLTIGCLNVSILLLARGVRREHELGVRRAMGASADRIVRQLLTESVVLALVGGGLGVAVAYGILSAILRWMPPRLLPVDIQIRINLQVLAVTLIVASLAGILAGLWPAIRSSRKSFNLLGAFTAPGATGTIVASRAHGLFVVGQLAMTVLLLAGAGAALRSFLSLTATRLGYDPQGVVLLPMALSDGAFTTWSERTAYYDQLRARVASIPGVESVAIQIGAPPPVIGGRSAFEIPGRPVAANDRVIPRMVGSEYFATLRIPMLYGRPWTADDDRRAARVAVINAAMARRYWPNGDALGQRLGLSTLRTSNNRFLVYPPNADQWVQIIGVAADARYNGLREAVLPTVHVPYTLVTADAMGLLVRGRGQKAAFVLAAKQQIAAVNRAQPVNEVSSLEEWLWSAGWGRQEFVASLFSLCAALALLLSGIGLFSVVACAVSRRTREFGLRVALGASRRHIVVQVFRDAGMKVAIGLVAGVMLTAIVSRPITRWTESAVLDVTSIGPAVLVLSLVSLCAILLPAGRAARRNPMVALRCD